MATLLWSTMGRWSVKITSPKFKTKLINHYITDIILKYCFGLVSWMIIMKRVAASPKHYKDVPKEQGRTKSFYVYLVETTSLSLISKWLVIIPMWWEIDLWLHIMIILCNITGADLSWLWFCSEVYVFGGFSGVMMNDIYRYTPGKYHRQS